MQYVSATVYFHSSTEILNFPRASSFLLFVLNRNQAFTIKVTFNEHAIIYEMIVPESFFVGVCSLN